LLRGDKLHLAWHVVSDRAEKRPSPDAEPTEIELPWHTPSSPTPTPSSAASQTAAAELATSGRPPSAIQVS
jgi:hypothetical protein